MPNRIVREGILSSERVDRIAGEPATEVFYRRLLSVADDFGRYSAHPSLLRASLYPLRTDKVSDSEIAHHLEACESAGLIRPYRVAGKPYVELLDFRQKTRAKQSKWPAPDQQMQRTCSASVPHMQRTRHADVLHMRTETETETYTETEARADDGAVPPDQFFEERYSRHPKKRDRILAEQALSGIPGIETSEVQEKFRSGHEAWIATDDYQWKGGAKCPTFAVFIADQTWQYLPTVNAPRESGPQYVQWKPPVAEGR